jgi:transcriptional regulator with XRE-family HTH domain
MPKSPPLTGHVARLIDGSLNAIAPRRSVKEIARMVGISAVMLSNVRHGRNKLPIEYVAKLASAFDIDPRHLLLLVLDEALRPEARNVITSLLGRLVTDNEMAIVEVVRVASEGMDPVVSKEVEDGLMNLFAA